jgi:superfamily II DNA helicase RecQ
MTTLSLEELARADVRLARRLKSPAPQRTAELLPLIRSELVRRGYRSVAVDVPELADIGAADWLSHSFVRVGESEWGAKPWLPSWLDHRGVAPDEAVACREPRRPLWKLAADRFYTDVMGHDDYLSPGQKECVRAVGAARGGDALICVLPTGSGKTDVVLSRAIRNRPRQTCIVVPTVSLALDLERRVQDVTKETDRLAYHGGLAKEDKASLVQRVQDGAQWLILTSPEAACTVLARPLEVAAAEGRLDQLVIDEAHIVSEWGDDFRPAYHAFAGLRRRLVENSPPNQRPITVMLTATLDDYGLEALRRLFPGDRELLVSAQVTRPEPAWWSSRCESEDEKRRRFLEVCRHMPRPMIVYTALHTSERSTTVSDVLTWLKGAGLNTARGVRGGASVSGWAAAVRGLCLAEEPPEDLDIVVGTSAFGLGVDIADVRGVIHLCVPESVNRLYQEVGRGGRDGTASLSMTLWTDSDAAVARDLATAKLIGEEKSWKRWQQMALGETDDSLIQVDLTSATDDVTYPWSDANRYWNMQTLSGMDRAGMISIEWPRPPELSVEATEEELQDAFAARHASTAVRLHHGDLDETRFRQRFRQSRATSLDASAASLQSATTILDACDTCVNSLLAKQYRLHTGSNLVSAARQCGGCPACRAAQATLRLLSDPVAPQFDGGPLTHEAGAAVRRLARGGKLCFWAQEGRTEEEEELVDRLVANGVVALVSEGPWWPKPRRTGSFWWQDRVADLLDGPVLRVPTLVRVDDEDPVQERVALLLSRLSRGPLTIVLTTEYRPNPFDPRARLKESWGPAYRVDQALRRL